MNQINKFFSIILTISILPESAPDPIFLQSLETNFWDSDRGEIYTNVWLDVSWLYIFLFLKQYLMSKKKSLHCLAINPYKILVLIYFKYRDLFDWVTLHIWYQLGYWDRTIKNKIFFSKIILNKSGNTHKNGAHRTLKSNIYQHFYLFFT